MAFHSDTVRRPDGRWVFFATEDNLRYEFVKAEKFTVFTEQELHTLRLDAMTSFDSALLREQAPVEEAGRPRDPVTVEIAGSNPAGGATRTFEWCSKHNLRTPCPVCADRAVIWDLVALIGGWDSFAMKEYSERGSTTDADRAALLRVRRGL